MGLNANNGSVYILTIITTNNTYKTTRISPITNSVYKRKTALFSHGVSALISAPWSMYLIIVLVTIVIKIAYSNPNTSCTVAPLAIVE